MTGAHHSEIDYILVLGHNILMCNYHLLFLQLLIYILNTVQCHLTDYNHKAGFQVLEVEIPGFKMCD
jgi:hypothetical protein